MTGIRLSKRPSSLVQGAFFLVLRLSNPLPCHNLPRQRRLIPSSLALCLPDLCTLLNPAPEASLRPVPTLSGLPFASRSSVAGPSCVPVLSLQTLVAADLLYAVPLLLGRLQGDGASVAGVLGPLSMQVHGKRDVRRCLCAVCAHDVVSCEVVVIV